MSDVNPYNLGEPAGSSNSSSSMPKMSDLEAEVSRLRNLLIKFDLTDDADTMWFDKETKQAYFRPKVPVKLIYELREALQATEEGAQ